MSLIFKKMSCNRNVSHIWNQLFDRTVAYIHLIPSIQMHSIFLLYQLSSLENHTVFESFLPRNLTFNGQIPMKKWEVGEVPPVPSLKSAPDCGKRCWLLARQQLW